MRILQLSFSNAIRRELECLPITSLSASCAIFVIGRKRRLRLFFGETLGASRHGILRAAQEGKANHISSHVPSYRDANDIVGRYEILSWRSRHHSRYVRIDNNVMIQFLFLNNFSHLYISAILTDRIKIIRVNFDMFFLCRDYE